MEFFFNNLSCYWKDETIHLLKIQFYKFFLQFLFNINKKIKIRLQLSYKSALMHSTSQLKCPVIFHRHHVSQLDAQKTISTCTSNININNNNYNNKNTKFIQKQFGYKHLKSYIRKEKKKIFVLHVNRLKVSFNNYSSIFKVNVAIFMRRASFVVCCFLFVLPFLL